MCKLVSLAILKPAEGRKHTGFWNKRLMEVESKVGLVQAWFLETPSTMIAEIEFIVTPSKSLQTTRQTDSPRILKRFLYLCPLALSPLPPVLELQGLWSQG